IRLFFCAGKVNYSIGTYWCQYAEIDTLILISVLIAPISIFLTNFIWFVGVLRLNSDSKSVL
ncbi:MAG: hypothetical protein RR455_13160, partial [Bacteroidales bacterium]